MGQDLVVHFPERFLPPLEAGGLRGVGGVAGLRVNAAALAGVTFRAEWKVPERQPQVPAGQFDELLLEVLLEAPAVRALQVAELDHRQRRTFLAEERPRQHRQRRRRRQIALRRGRWRGRRSFQEESNRAKLLKDGAKLGRRLVRLLRRARSHGERLRYKKGGCDRE